MIDEARPPSCYDQPAGSGVEEGEPMAIALGHSVPRAIATSSGPPRQTMPQCHRVVEEAVGGG